MDLRHACIIVFSVLTLALIFSYAKADSEGPTYGLSFVDDLDSDTTNRDWSRLMWFGAFSGTVAYTDTRSANRTTNTVRVDAAIKNVDTRPRGQKSYFELFIICDKKLYARGNETTYSSEGVILRNTRVTPAQAANNMKPIKSSTIPHYVAQQYCR